MIIFKSQLNNNYNALTYSFLMVIYTIAKVEKNDIFHYTICTYIFKYVGTRYVFEALAFTIIYYESLRQQLSQKRETYFKTHQNTSGSVGVLFTPIISTYKSHIIIIIFYA